MRTLFGRRDVLTFGARRPEASCNPEGPAWLVRLSPEVADPSSLGTAGARPGAGSRLRSPPLGALSRRGAGRPAALPREGSDR
jgi:hypothetical protein